MMENLTHDETRIGHNRLRLVGNNNFMDGLGAFRKIFNQTNQKRPEAKVDLRGQMTTLSK